MELIKGTSLYRYGLGDNIPSDWSEVYHSPEYSYADYGFKNQIGAYFFYCDKETALNVMYTAIQKFNELGKRFSNGSMTWTNTLDNINLLDLTGCSRPVEIIMKLINAGIDVLTDEFVCHSNKKQSFSTIRYCCQCIIDGSAGIDLIEQVEVIKAAKTIDSFFIDSKEYTGQVMTDFNNGLRFKELLEEFGYEGYVFDEERTSPTICLLHAEKLTPPNHTTVNISSIDCN